MGENWAGAMKHAGIARVIAFTVFIAALAMLVQAQTASDEVRLGVEAYKKAQYQQAISHFQRAVQADPSLTTARIYLATAYTQMYIPGADSPDNNRYGEMAIEQFTLALQARPTAQQELRAQKGIASLYFNMKKFDEAMDQYVKASELDPGDPENYYAMGVIDWCQSYAPRMELRTSLGLKPTDELLDSAACERLRSVNQQRVEDGIQKLQHALELRPDYDDAMAYLNLMYREKADYECGDPSARQQDLRTADKWVDTTIATKKAKAEKQSNVVRSDSPQ